MDRPTMDTHPVRVLIITDDYEINGFIHVKPGGYLGRVSDILNQKEVRYIPVTDVVFHSLRNPDEPPRRAPTLIIRNDTIKMVAPESMHETQSPSL